MILDHSYNMEPEGSMEPGRKVLCGYRMNPEKGMLEERNECSNQNDHEIIVKEGIRKLGLRKRNQEKGIRN